MQKETFTVAETQLCCLYQTTEAINVCLSLVGKKSANVNASQEIGLRQKGGLRRVDYRIVLCCVPGFSNDVACRAENMWFISSAAFFQSLISCMKDYTDI